MLSARRFLLKSPGFTLIALFACCIPARQITRVDPFLALHTE